MKSTGEWYFLMRFCAFEKDFYALNKRKGMKIKMENQVPKKPVIFSGIQPSGTITIGNYYGAIKNWLTMQQDFDSYYCIVDLHSITVRQNPAELRKKSRELLALYIASGLDPVKNTLYIQSQVRQHAELAWILGCYTYMGELNRMTQFKDKSVKNEQNINAGLYTYPVLMAADILLYQTDLVPIGNDQKQHLELARDIAIRFNTAYSDTFKVPEGYFGKVGAKIYSLQQPTAKMSKSDANENGYISLLDEEAVIRKKIKRAVTDSVGEINYCPEQPGVCNLIDIYACATEQSVADSISHFEGRNYGFLKSEVTEALLADILPIQNQFHRLMQDKTYLDTIIQQNSQKAAQQAEKTLRKVKKKVGFIV